MEENKLLKLNKKELVALFYVSKEMSRGFPVEEKIFGCLNMPF